MSIRKKRRRYSSVGDISKRKRKKRKLYSSDEDENEHQSRDTSTFSDEDNDENNNQYNEDYLLLSGLEDNDDDDDKDEVQILPASPSDDEDSDCEICDNELPFSGTTQLARSVHSKCLKIIRNGLKRNKKKKAIGTVLDYVNNMVIKPLNEYKDKTNDSSIKKVSLWDKKSVKQHFIGCLGNVKTRCEDDLRVMRKLAKDLEKYDAYYMRNDGPVDPETGRKTFVKHCRPPVVKAVCTIRKECIGLDIKLSRLTFRRRNTTRDYSL
jgi:hypothetical protein